MVRIKAPGRNFSNSWGIRNHRLINRGQFKMKKIKRFILGKNAKY